MAETIDKIFNFHLHSLILTGRRIISAQTVKQKGPNNEQTMAYRSWNIPYRDILMASYFYFDYKEETTLTEEKLKVLLEGGKYKAQNVFIIMKIHY